MNLLINAVSANGKLILFDESRQILAQRDIFLHMNESSKLIGEIDTFLQEQQTPYDDLKNIVVIHGPGSFTGIRTIVLYVNTLAFIYKNIHLTPVNFFDLFSDYPIVKTSSKRDLFVKNDKNDIINIVRNEDFLEYNSQRMIYGDALDLGIDCNTSIDYPDILSQIALDNKKRIEPLYIKKPNIT